MVAFFFFFFFSVPFPWHSESLWHFHSDTPRQSKKSPNQTKKKKKQPAGSEIWKSFRICRRAVNMGYVPVHVSYFYSLLISNKAP